MLKMMTKWLSDRVTEWPSDCVTDCPSDRKLRRRLTVWYISMSHTHWEQAATSPVCQYVLCVMCYVLCVRCGGRVSTRTAPADSGPGPTVAPQHQHSYQQQQASCQGTGILFGTFRIKLNIQDLHHPIRLYIAHPKSLIPSNRILYSKLNCKTLL